ncbi:MAG: IPTL-CTERM sorting domain-containing protein [Saprospiraceae bacterium]
MKKIIISLLSLVGLLVQLPASFSQQACQVSGGVGCAECAACEASVCGYDSFCCSNAWDGICVGEAATDPNCTYAPGGPCAAAPPAVPTMGQWGLIILALLTLSFGTVFLMRSRMAVAGAGNVSMGSGIPFDKSSYGKMLAAVMASVAVVFAVAVAAFGYEMTSADVPGSLLAGPVMAYLLHLLVPSRKEG